MKRERKARKKADDVLRPTSVGFTPAEIEALREAAETLDRSVSWIVRRAVAEWIERKKGRR
jgi:predicted transcriptional regulator